MLFTSTDRTATGTVTDMTLLTPVSCPSSLQTESRLRLSEDPVSTQHQLTHTAWAAIVDAEEGIQIFGGFTLIVLAKISVHSVKQSISFSLFTIICSANGLWLWHPVQPPEQEPGHWLLSSLRLRLWRFYFISKHLISDCAEMRNLLNSDYAEMIHNQE